MNPFVEWYKAVLKDAEETDDTVSLPEGIDSPDKFLEWLFKDEEIDKSG